MNWLDTHLAVLDTATAGVEFAVNWLLQSTLLITVGLSFGWLLRKRGSAVQSVVFRTTLAAVLGCPLATWGLSAAGVSGWSVEMPVAWSQQDVDSQISAVDSLDLVAASELAAPIDSPVLPTSFPPLLDVPPRFEADRTVASTASNQSTSLAVDETPTREVPSIIAGSPSAQPRDSQTAGISIHRFGMAALAAMAIWLCVSSLLTIRLVTAWARLGRLRRQAVRADADTVSICHEFASRLGVSAPEVLRSPCLPSPCLAGIG